MALLLIILGIVIWLLVSSTIGLLLVIVGLILLFVPAVPYGYHTYSRRRPPP